MSHRRKLFAPLRANRVIVAVRDNKMGTFDRHRASRLRLSACNMASAALVYLAASCGSNSNSTKPRAASSSEGVTLRTASASSQPALDAGGDVRVLEPTRATTADESTYTDGSWSVEDVLSKSPGTMVTVTGHVNEIYLCQPCPKGAHCKPCGPGIIILSDSPEGSVASLYVVLGPPTLPSNPVRGQRYQFTGILEAPKPFVMPVTAHCLKYNSYGPAPVGLQRRSNRNGRTVEPRN